MKEEKSFANVAISNRHVHLTKEIFDLLFDEPLEVKKPLNQEGEFASTLTLTIKGPKDELENVRVMGPHRSYNQIEVSKSDARKLGINPPVRRSGDVEESEAITLITPKNSITLDSGCIIAERHVHMNPKKASSLGLNDGDIVKLIVSNDKAGIMMAHVKVTRNGYYEVHLDIDDANAFFLNTGDQVEIRK